MNRFLPHDFHGEKYGLSFRLVQESDAEFIYRLRSNPDLSRYIHDVEGGVDGQVKWIRDYKIREAEGVDYYFIFLKDGEPVGLNRIYSIHDRTYTGGSWVMAPNSPMEVVLAVPLIIREIAFEKLGMAIEDNYDGVHIDNKKVLKFNMMFGCEIYKHFFDMKGEYLAMSLTKEAFEANKPKLVAMLNLDNNE